MEITGINSSEKMTRLSLFLPQRPRAPNCILTWFRHGVHFLKRLLSAASYIHVVAILEKNGSSGTAARVQLPLSISFVIFHQSCLRPTGSSVVSLTQAYLAGGLTMTFLFWQLFKLLHLLGTSHSRCCSPPPFQCLLTDILSKLHATPSLLVERNNKNIYH